MSRGNAIATGAYLNSASIGSQVAGLLRFTVQELIEFSDERCKSVVILLGRDLGSQFPQSLPDAVIALHQCPCLRVCSCWRCPASCRTAIFRSLSMCSRITERSSDMTLGRTVSSASTAWAQSSRMRSSRRRVGTRQTATVESSFLYSV